MVEIEFPARLYKKGDEPEPQKSINHNAAMKLLSRLKTALHRDEWEYLRNSPLGVFIKFHELKFALSLRIVHYILTSQLVCNQKYEIWCLIGDNPIRFSLNEFQEITDLNCGYIKNLGYPTVEVTREIEEFWGKLGVPVEVGPSINSLIAACDSCESWTREERIKLGFLSIYASFIDASDGVSRKGTRVGMGRLVMDLAAFVSYPWGRVAFEKLIKSVKKANLANSSYTLKGFVQVLQVWAFYALPDFGAEYGQPIIPAPRPILLSYKSRRLKNITADALFKQTRVHNFVVKDYEEMFPLWDGDDVEDDKIVNIVKAVFGEFGDWKFTCAHWSEVVPNKKRDIDSGEGSRKKRKTLVSSEAEDEDETDDDCDDDEDEDEDEDGNEILALEILKNGIDTITKVSGLLETLSIKVNTIIKNVDTLKHEVGELKQGPTVASPTVSLPDLNL